VLTVRLPRQGGFSSLDVECICLPTREDGPRSARCDLNESDPSNHITAQREPPPNNDKTPTVTGGGVGIEENPGRGFRHFQLSLGWKTKLTASATGFVLSPERDLPMPGMSQGSAYPENDSIGENSIGVSSSTDADERTTDAPPLHTRSAPSLAPGEWEAAVAAAIAAVSAEEACADPDTDDSVDNLVAELVDTQLPGGRVYTLPLPDGAAARVPTWRSRSFWLSVCQAASECERGKAALRRHRIAAATFLRGCAAHAEFAESSTGRRVAVALKTLIDRSGLSIDQLKRCRRVLKTLELGVEHVRGKKLNQSERAAAEQLYRSVHGTTPPRMQRGAASVWGLSTPRWALTLLPSQTVRKRTRPTRTRRRNHQGIRVRKASVRPSTSTVCIPTPPRPQTHTPRAYPPESTAAVATMAEAEASVTSCAPQSSGGSFSSGLSVRKDHQARARAGEKQKSKTDTRSLNLQRAAAELIRRIPALANVVGDHRPTTSRPRSHVGSVCDLLVDAGIDTERWSGIDIAATLTHDGISKGWTWPSVAEMTSPLRLVAYRLSLVDWSRPSPTDIATRDRRYPGETAVAAAYRMITNRRNAVHHATAQMPEATPASEEHRRRMRAEFAATRAAARRPSVNEQAKRRGHVV
jgi:hypothetical protein